VRPCVSVGLRRGVGLAPMETDPRLDDFTRRHHDHQQEDEDGDDGDDDDDGDDSNGGGGGGGNATKSIEREERYRYVAAPEHVGISARAQEVGHAREDRVRRRREREAHGQWTAARGLPPQDRNTWAADVRSMHQRQASGSDAFQRGYLTARAGMAQGPKAPVAASATRAFSGMRALNEILPRPALDPQQPHWTANRPAAQGEYTPMGSANRMSLI